LGTLRLGLQTVLPAACKKCRHKAGALDRPEARRDAGSARLPGAAVRQEAVAEAVRRRAGAGSAPGAPGEAERVLGGLPGVKKVDKFAAPTAT
jgi:hypothetical protein